MPFLWFWVLLGKEKPNENGYDRLTLLLICSGILVIPALIAAVFLSFAPKSPGPTRAPGKDLAANPLEAARQMLSRERDIETCRAALAQIKTYLDKNEKRRPPSLTDAERSDLEKRFGLDGGELAEVDSDTFTPLDGHYLDLCFLLRDAATSLAVEIPSAEKGKDRPTPLRQAETAFGWTVRQVRQEKTDLPPVPPQFVLRRGWGSALDRALVFVELLRHVGRGDDHLTACLVYCPDKSGDMRPWACGVVVGDGTDVYLFDPRLGLPVPGPKGEGVATLAQARTDPTVLGQLTVTADHPYDVTAEQAAKAELRYVCSLTGLAPRMKSLQDDLLPPAVKVRLAVAPGADMDRLAAAAKAVGPDTHVAAWNDGKATGVGVLRRFLPPQEGGVDAERRGRLTLYVWGDEGPQGSSRGIVPVREMPPLFKDPNLFPFDSAFGTRVRNSFADPFFVAVTQPHHSRDELLRGRFSKAIDELVAVKDRCLDAQRFLERDAKDPEFEKKLQQWIKDAFDAYAELQKSGKDPARMEAANEKINALWQSAGGTVGLILAGTRSLPLRRETVFQLALCKHEQAEQVRQEIALRPNDEELAQRAVDAWKEAESLWRQYLEEFGNRKEDNTAGAAARMRGEALLSIGDRAGAVRTWRLAYTTSELEKVGSLYLAKKAER